MGRWMEVVSEYPPPRNDEGDYSDVVVDELAPHPLIYARSAMGRKAGAFFPELSRVWIHSGAYVDEDLWLSPAEVPPLLTELAELRQVCRYERFLPGVNGAMVYANWRDFEEEAVFEEHLDAIESLLARAAAEGLWVHLML